MPQSGKQYKTLAILGSLCLFLSAIEYLIPKPLPFMRIGLANLPLLLALDILAAGDFFLLALLKVLGQGIIGGTLFSYVFLFSLAGTFSSAALMYILRRLLGKKRVGFTGLGCAGAMASNGVQLLLARYFIFGSGLRYLMPPFLASGFITGIALGLFCEYFSRRSFWYASHTRYVLHTGDTSIGGEDKDKLFFEKAEAKATPERTVWENAHCKGRGRRLRRERRLRRNRLWNNLFNADELFIAGIIMMALFLFTRSAPLYFVPISRFAQFLFFCFLAWRSGKKMNLPAAAAIIAGIVFFNLLAPHGKVIASLGSFRITQGSLYAGLEKAFTLEGLVMLSRACIKSDLRLPGTLGSLLGETFRILELMREKKSFIGKGLVVSGIDRLLLEMESADTEEQMNAPRKKVKRKIGNILLLCGMVLATGLIKLTINNV
jgi:heptaprenyl diphosphate synthase